MSLDSWKAEFYPVEASVNMTDLESDDKPLPKWAEYWMIGFLVLAVVAVSPVLLPPIIVGWVADKLSRWWDKD